MKRLVAGLVVLIFCFCVFGQEAKRPNFLIITLDTFRADRLQVYGGKGNLAPNLDKFSQEAMVFTNSITPTPVTLPAHAVIFTGCYQDKTNLYDNGVGALSPKVRTVAEVLKERGYDTRAYVAAEVLKSKYGLSRGFSIYDDELGVTGRRYAEEITERALSFLSGKKEKPFFLWLHYFDAHQPYLTPETPFGEVQGEYDKAVSYLDKDLKRVLDAIPANTIVFVVSDHGEGLKDHGELTHGLLLYQPTMKVVIMVKGEGFQKGTDNKFKTLADIAPTIYKILGERVEGLDGVPLDDDKEKIVPLMTLLPLNEYRWKPLFGVTDGKYKWIKGDELKLYDLINDPNETVDISKAAPKESVSLKTRIPKYEALRSNIEIASFSGLGYLTGTPTKDANIESFPDPEKMLSVFYQIDQIRILREKRNYADSGRIAEESLKKDKGNPSLLFAYGDSLRHLEKLDEAIKYLDESLKISPALVPSLVSKGYALLAKDKKEEAVKCFEKALEYDPDSIEAINPMVGYYLEINKPQIALPMLEDAIKRGIATADTYLMQGRVHLI
ncbi:MAG: sulfatase-like hydrolase/transferase, partial [Acidobacteria bacterium]|nr:sulfatase-like hydrolase/transferase [Acidobacteriota bacterium]